MSESEYTPFTESVESLARRERRLAAAQRIARLGYWEWDVRADTVVWSDGLYRIFGLDPSAYTPTFRGYLNRIHSADRDRVRGVIEGAFHGDATFAFRERIVRPDGTVRTLRSRGEVVRDEAGNPARMLGVCQDVTEERAEPTAPGPAALEERLRAAVDETRERLLTAFLGVPAPVGVLRGPDHVVEQANPAFLAILGGPRLGRPLLLTLPELASQGFGAVLDRAFRTGEPQLAPGARLSRDETGGGDDTGAGVYDLSCQPILDPDGSVWGLLAHAVPTGLHTAAPSPSRS